MEKTKSIDRVKEQNQQKELLLNFIDWYFEQYHPSIDFPNDEDIDDFMDLISKES